MNTTSSGSHHLATLPARKSRISSLVMSPRYCSSGDDAGQRALLPFGMEDGDHGRFHHLGMRHDGVFQIDAGDPFAAALHQVLGAIHDLDVAFRIDGGDIAGAEPAVGERFVAARIVVVSAARPRDRGSAVRPWWCRPREAPLPSASTMRISTPATGRPCRASRSKRSFSGKLSRCFFSAMKVAMGVVSVMPQASRKWMPYFFSYHSMNWRGMAEPADHHHAERGKIVRMSFRGNRRDPSRWWGRRR